MKLSIDVTDEEMHALHKIMPLLETMHHLIPSGLVTLVKKVEQAVRDSHDR